MNKSLTALAALLVCSAGVGSAAVAAGAPINLKGRWAGTSESIERGNAMHHVAQNGAQPGLDNVAFTFTFVGQDGHRFWGTVSSKRGEEQFIGVVARDGKRLMATDSDGYFEGTIVDRNTIDVIYFHTGASSVVANNRIRRQR